MVPNDGEELVPADGRVTVGPRALVVLQGID
jgi:hypothetical protein